MAKVTITLEDDFMNGEVTCDVDNPDKGEEPTAAQQLAVIIVGFLDSIQEAADAPADDAA